MSRPAWGVAYPDPVTTAERTWRPPWPCPLGQELAPLRHGAGDPTFRRELDGTHWRAIRTPAGPATLRLEPRPLDREIRCTAWGPGALWALESVPAMLGGADDDAGFPAGRHPVVDRLRRTFPHWRMPRTGRVMEALVPAVIEQKVTGAESFAGFRRLVRRFGEPAPGDGSAVGLMIQPEPAAIARIASWEWLRLGIDHARSRTLAAAAQRADALERTLVRDHTGADRGLRSIPGIGVWTSAETRARSHGDPDALSLGDLHVAKDVGFALTGERMDDAALADLLEPFRGHRYRVQRLVELSGVRAPRRGPRLAPRTHLPV